MRADGVYDIVISTWQATGSAQVVMVDGRFEGMTDRGTWLEGVCTMDPTETRLIFEMQVHIPPGIETVAGVPGGPDGRSIPVKGELPWSWSGEEKRFSVALAGRAVDVAMRYAGPIPDTGGER